MKCCRTAIKTDKQNYTAWLFAGKAACEIDAAELPNNLQQAEQAYRKAIEVDSKNPLAWKVLYFTTVHLRVRNSMHL